MHRAYPRTPVWPRNCVITSYSIHYTKLYEPVAAEAAAPVPRLESLDPSIILRALSQLLVEKGVISRDEFVQRLGELAAREADRGVITSYSIHYTKLYEGLSLSRPLSERAAGLRRGDARPDPAFRDAHDAMPRGGCRELAVTERSPAPILRVEGLRTWFPIRKGLFQRSTGWVRAVDGVDLAIPAGRTLALVGESYNFV